MSKDRKTIGEGNRQADRRYREDVRDTVENTSAEERANAARDVSDAELDEAEAAAKAGKSRARR